MLKLGTEHVFGVGSSALLSFIDLDLELRLFGDQIYLGFGLDGHRHGVVPDLIHRLVCPVCPGENEAIAAKRSPWNGRKALSEAEAQEERLQQKRPHIE